MTLKQHASRLVEAVPESLRLALAADPETALSGLTGIRVMPVPQLQDVRGGGGWCDGLSFMNDGTSATRRHPDRAAELYPAARVRAPVRRWR